MKKTTAVLICLLLCLALVGLVAAKYSHTNAYEHHERVWHHELSADADVTLGTETVPEDGIVDESFVSHLPLVVIDTKGEPIVNYKIFDDRYNSFIIPEGVDPYVNMELTLIDGEDHVNSLGDDPTLVTDGRIKIRGNSSASVVSRFRLQYLLKLETSDGENNPQAVFGMEANDTWVLNCTMIDKSFLRNYIAYNSAGELDPYTPDMRFCEVFMKQGDTYEYIGLYGMYEKVEQGVGRVDIPKVSNPISVTDRSYIVQRDRFDPESRNIAVYSTMNQREENWITLEYPSADKITDEYWDYIQQDILRVEEILYSDIPKEFAEYRAVLDVDSFVDYMVINEFFSNYDAGWNSTFLYKTAEGKLAIGPVWDFDNAMDNYELQLMNMNAIAFSSSPWYERLLRDEQFCNQLLQRYQELREGILSNETISEKIAQAEEFIRMPVSRDVSRWENVGYYDLENLVEDGTDYLIIRDQHDALAEIQRLKDTILLHAEYLDKNLGNVLNGLMVAQDPVAVSLGGWLVIIIFFVAVVLVQRVRRGQ